MARTANCGYYYNNPKSFSKYLYLQALCTYLCNKSGGIFNYKGYLVSISTAPDQYLKVDLIGIESHAMSRNVGGIL